MNTNNSMRDLSWVQPGLVVRLKEEVTEEVRKFFGWAEEMDEYLGKTVTLAEERESTLGLCILEDNGEYIWHVDCFELIEPDEHFEDPTDEEIATLLA